MSAAGLTGPTQVVGKQSNAQLREGSIPRSPRIAATVWSSDTSIQMRMLRSPLALACRFLCESRNATREARQANCNSAEHRVLLPSQIHRPRNHEPSRKKLRGIQLDV